MNKSLVKDLVQRFANLPAENQKWIGEQLQLDGTGSEVPSWDQAKKDLKDTWDRDPTDTEIANYRKALRDAQSNPEPSHS